MLFCQLGQAHSLREICNGLASCFGKLRHLGISRGPKRSTLAYANEHRSWELFQEVFYALLSRCRGEFLGKRKFRFKNKFSPAAIVVFDRGLVDYQLFGEWTEEGVYFVTRLKDNADYRVVKRLPVPENRNILKDEIIRLTGDLLRERALDKERER